MASSAPQDLHHETAVASESSHVTATPLDLFHFNPLSFSLTLAIFISLLVVLSLKVWRPVLKALDERDDSIRDDLDKAEASRKEAEALLQEQKVAMDNLREEAKRIREEVMALAEKQKGELLASARSDAEKLLANTREELLREKEAIFEEVKDLAVEVGVELASKILSREMNPDSHKDAIKASLSRIETAFQKAV
jgi:F-type H+-transporting ATPase subunit b